jgi:serine/threonine-protein kinase
VADDPRVGKVLQGRYKIGTVLAEGGMGIVYKGERVGIGRPVVVKFLHAILSDTPGIVDRFEREARATARLNHPNCVALVDYGIEENTPYLVMEYAEGKTLADLLDHGALAPRRAVRIARQVLAGLSHAHERGILHRDLKPANIMVVDAVGHTDFVKILDFGLAKLLGQADNKKDVTVAGIAIGTPGYMSPEQAAGVPSDRRSDIYCTGALLYHLVTGTKAFEGDDIHSVLRRHREEAPQAPRKLDPQSPVSKQLEAVLLRSMEREPAKRYQTAEEMIEALKATPEGQRQNGPDTSSPSQRTPSSSSVDDKTRAETSQSRKRMREATRNPWLSLAAGLLLGGGGTVLAALYTPLMTRLKGPEAVAESRVAHDANGRSAPRDTARASAHDAVPNARTASPPRSEPQPPTDDPAMQTATAPAHANETPSNVPPHVPDGGPAVASTDEEDDDGPQAKADDGSNENDQAPPPEVPAAPHREMPQVRTIADVKTLLRKGDADGALAGLYRLRKQKPTSPRQSAEIATLIGNLYFDRHWWTDALREYRFACRQDPHAKSDSILVNNTVRTMLDHSTYWRSRRLVLDYIGKNATPALRRAARDGQTADFRRRAQRVLDSLDGHRTASRRR